MRSILVATIVIVIVIGVQTVKISGTCTMDPECQNGGTCVSSMCNCASEFTGTNCEIDDCVGVTCETKRFNQVCYQGMCVCQESCPMSRSDEDMVCGSDQVTYDTVCHLKAAACQTESNLTVEYYGPCDEFSDYSGSGATPPNEFEFYLCDETSCSFGGICRPLSADTYLCICKFNCSAVRLPVCGSDGATYGNECQLKEAACEQLQSSIVLEKIGTCEDVEMEPCDGESPLVNEATMEAYTCQEDNGGQDCPSGSYCHIHPHGMFSVCCAVTSDRTTEATAGPTSQAPVSGFADETTEATIGPTSQAPVSAAETTEVTIGPTSQAPVSGIADETTETTSRTTSHAPVSVHSVPLEADVVRRKATLFKRIHQGGRLRNHAIKTKHGSSFVRCVSECNELDDCVSFNIGNGVCELNNQVVGGTGVSRYDFVEDEGLKYYEKQ